MYLDAFFTFSNPCVLVATRVSKRTMSWQALTGDSKRRLPMTYKALEISITNCTGLDSSTSIAKIQCTQNEALKTSQAHIRYQV